MSGLRFTDRPPPPEVLAEYANWVHAHGEEGRRGQDETTIKPQRRKSRIDDDTRYTAAEVWLADDTETVGLLWLSAGEAIGITTYDGEAVWRLSAGRAGNLWRPLGSVPPGRLPLRYCTRLTYEGRPLKEWSRRTVSGPSGRWTASEQRGARALNNSLGQTGHAISVLGAQRPLPAGPGELAGRRKRVSEYTGGNTSSAEVKR